MGETTTQNNKGCLGVIAAGGLALLVFVASKGVQKTAEYGGINNVIPLIGSLLIGWVAYKKLRQALQPMVPAIAVLGGQLAWYCLGALYLGNWLVVIPDIAILSAGIYWLIARPGVGPIILLIGYQALGLIANLMMLASSDIESDAPKALVTHVLLRLLAIVLLLAGKKNYLSGKTR
jgi:hypothetical protein